LTERAGFPWRYDQASRLRRLIVLPGTSRTSKICVQPRLFGKVSRFSLTAILEVIIPNMDLEYHLSRGTCKASLRAAVRMNRHLRRTSWFTSVTLTRGHDVLAPVRIAAHHSTSTRFTGISPLSSAETVSRTFRARSCFYDCGSSAHSTSAPRPCRPVSLRRQNACCGSS